MGVFQRTQKGFGFVRLAGATRLPASERRLHSGRSCGRRRHRRHGSGAVEKATPRRSRPARRNRRDPRAPDAPVRRHVFRVRRGGVCADQRRPVRTASLRRRSRGEECAGRRQGRHRDDPLSVAAVRRRRGYHRGAWPARQAGRRHAVDHPRVQPARPFCRGRVGRGPATCRQRSTRPLASGPTSPARRSSRSTRPTRGILTTPFRLSGWTTATGGWGSILPTCRTSCGRARRWIARRLDRATSVYLPDRVIPMLPELISNGLASLQPGKIRYTKSAVLEFTADGLRVVDRTALGRHSQQRSG